MVVSHAGLLGGRLVTAVIPWLQRIWRDAAMTKREAEDVLQRVRDLMPDLDRLAAFCRANSPPGMTTASSENWGTLRAKCELGTVLHFAGPVVERVA